MTERRERQSRRGLRLLGLLAVLVLLAGGSSLALVLSAKSDSGRALPQDFIRMAKCAFADQEFVHAETCLRQAGADISNDVEIKLFYARVLLELGRVKAAQEIFNTLHKADEKTVEALVGMGMCHERLMQWDLAIACYRRASELRKDQPRILKLLALAQYRRGDPMASLFTLRHALKVQPGQEDLSHIMNEIGMARQAKADAAGQRRQPAAFDPFEDMNPGFSDRRGFNPAMPGPGIPDPTGGLPRPGGERPR